MIAIGTAEKSKLIAVDGDIGETLCETNESYIIYQWLSSVSTDWGHLRKLLIS